MRSHWAPRLRRPHGERTEGNPQERDRERTEGEERDRTEGGPAPYPAPGPASAKDGPDCKVWILLTKTKLK